MSRRSWLMPLMACVTIAAAGCGSAPAAPASAPVTLPPLATLPSLDAVRWSATIPPPSTFSIAPDASTVAGASVPAGGGPAIPWAFTDSGGPIVLDGQPDGAVFALSGESVVVGPGVSDQTGPVTLITPAGRPWSASAVGPIFATSNLSGSRLAILDGGSASLDVLQVAGDGSVSTLPLVGLHALGAGTSAQFDDLGDVLVADAQQAALFGPSGLAQWAVPLHANALPRSFVLDRDGGGITAATSGNDNTLYQFVAPGGRPGVAWTEALVAGGGNQLVAGPDGRVAIGAVGGGAALAVYRTQDGALQWQDTLTGPDGVTPSVGGLAFGPRDGVVAVVTGCEGAGDVCLILLRADGSPVGVVDLGIGVRVALAANGKAAAVVSPAARGNLAWLDLSGLWTGTATPATTSSS